MHQWGHLEGLKLPPQVKNFVADFPRKPSVADHVVQTMSTMLGALDPNGSSKYSLPIRGSRA
jgi:hypothetical protein